MIVCFGEIEELRSDKVIFLSAKYGNASLFEFEKFDSLELTNPVHLEERDILFNVIDQIRYRGAKEYFFKHEGSAKALPRVSQLQQEKNKGDYGLRLYCILLREDLVILLNGGIKTKIRPQDCPNVKDHFDKANKIAIKLNAGIRQGLINLTSEGIEIDESFDFEI